MAVERHHLNARFSSETGDDRDGGLRAALYVKSSKIEVTG